MTAAILASKNLVCGYHANQPLTVPLTFEVARNDIVAILGVNGRGKSTLLHTLLGTQKPLSGSIIANGTLSFVPQNFITTFDYSVLDIVLMGRAKQLGLFRRPSPDDIRLAQQNLQHLGLQAYSHHPFSHLSGGQQQLVLIARALTAECPLLLLDEPTSALDLHNQQQVLHILASLRQQRDLTIILSTHDPAQAMAIANKVLLLEQDGYAFGPAETLLTEQRLSQLYRIKMKTVTLDQTTTIVPLYSDLKV